MQQQKSSLGRGSSITPIVIAAAVALSFAFPTLALAQRSSATVYVPPSSVQNAADAGKFAHTNYLLRTTNGQAPKGAATIPLNTFLETPASLGCVYKLPLSGPAPAGCAPAGLVPAVHPVGGWGAIALVDAFDNPNIGTDLITFNAAFGIPFTGGATLSRIFANGNGSCTTPPPNLGWELEESLDVEWAHAMAPGANIYLVEACSNSYADLLYAESVAAGLVGLAGGGALSNSWGSGEFAGETSDDLYFYVFNYPNTVYLASAGDFGCGAAYPSSSPWVVSAGGTTVNRNLAARYTSESCWAGSGGGSSSQETYVTSFTQGNMGPWADYQYPIFGQASRQTPDLAFDADPASGVYVYSQDNGGWFAVGGTSVSSPSLAGILNIANNRLGQAKIYPVTSGGFYTNEENNLLYSQLDARTAYVKNFYDVKTGSNGCTVTTNWDYCTGVGSPRGLLGK